eukprot:530353_1
MASRRRGRGNRRLRLEKQMQIQRNLEDELSKLNGAEAPKIAAYSIQSHLLQRPPDPMLSDTNPFKSKLKTTRKVTDKSMSKGYICDDGVIAIANVTEMNDDQIKIACNLDGAENSYLRKGFWMDKQDKRVITKPKTILKEITENSHNIMFNKWINTFYAKYKYCSEFDAHIFGNIIKTLNEHNTLLFTIKEMNYAKPLQTKHYNNVLSSFVCWALSLNCQLQRCSNSLKINCYCKLEEFPTYVYYTIMSLIACEKEEANNHELILIKGFLRAIKLDKSINKQYQLQNIEQIAQDINLYRGTLLNIIKTTNNKNISSTAQAICTFLPLALQTD